MQMNVEKQLGGKTMSEFQYEINGKMRKNKFEEALYALQMISIETEEFLLAGEDFSFRFYVDGVEIFNNYKALTDFMYEECRLAFVYSDSFNGDIAKEVTPGQYISIYGREGFNEHYNMGIEIELRGVLRVLLCSTLAANLSYMNVA